MVFALVAANFNEPWYREIVYRPLFDLSFLGHPVTLNFLVNDIFMVLFFGLATKEIVSGMKPGGVLHPPRRAANAIFASVGGVVAPALIYLGLIHGLFRDVPDHDVLMNAWAVPTATDIALVWMTARLIFGASHPAVNYLLLLAVVDDLLGLVILAVVYSDSTSKLESVSVLLICSGIAFSWMLYRLDVRSWLPYVCIGGPLVWFGLLDSPIHPALALVLIVPFLPGRPVGGRGEDTAAQFERAVKPIVDTGLFFFGFANSGVPFGDVLFVTWVVLAALILGKTLGITASALAAARWFGWPLPSGMHTNHVVLAGLLASIGLTVALFITGQAFPPESPYQAAARMGALLSVVVAILALLGSRFHRRFVQPRPPECTPSVNRAESYESRSTHPS